jgi:DtxR family Mn-dependent transcriptional regulator
MSTPAETSTDPVVSPSAARYLEAAYYIQQEGEVVRPGRLAEWLGVAAPTVTQAVARLQRDGLLTTGSDRSIDFTRDGLRAAEDIVRRHRVVEAWLTMELGLDWVTADTEAQQLAHSFSEDVLTRMWEKLGRPRSCPHGNAIPGVPQPERDLVNLSSLARGDTSRVARISEVAEHEAPDLLTLLYEARIIPGSRLTVLSEPGDDEFVLEVGDTRRQIPGWAASAIWVERT